MSVDFTRKPTLAGDLVTLRPARGSDAVVLHGYLDDLEVSRLTGAIHSSSEPGPPAWTVGQLEEIYDVCRLAEGAPGGGGAAAICAYWRHACPTSPHRH